ncbi:MAG: hypothetical protein KHZ65_20810, partial [Phocaeicola vulgatus]|nr:hypothetical protein [Phocaeicola vulgatus]
MNEISTALKTLTDKITVKLEIGEKHFNVFLCIALCALVIYPLLFTAVVHFRTLPLGWKSHSTLTLLATQDLPTFLYYMIDPLKSWCWGA